MTRSDREAAILAMARPHMKRLDVDDVEALCELAMDDDGVDLAGMILKVYIEGCPTAFLITETSAREVGDAQDEVIA